MIRLAHVVLASSLSLSLFTACSNTPDGDRSSPVGERPAKGGGASSLGDPTTDPTIDPTTDPLALDGELIPQPGFWWARLRWDRRGVRDWEVLVKRPGDAGFAVVDRLTEDLRDPIERYVDLRIPRAVDGYAIKVRGGAIESAVWSPVLDGAFVAKSSPADAASDIVAVAFSDEQLALGLASGNLAVSSAASTTAPLELTLRPGSTIASVSTFQLLAASGALPAGRYALVAYRDGVIAVVGLGGLGASPRSFGVVPLAAAGTTTLGARLVRSSADELTVLVGTTESLTAHTLAFGAEPAPAVSSGRPLAQGTLRAFRARAATGTAPAILAWDGDDGVAIAEVSDWLRLDALTARPLTTCAAPSEMVLDAEQLALLCTGDARSAIELVPLAAALSGGATQSARIETDLPSENRGALLFPTVELTSGRSLFILHDVLSVGTDGALTRRAAHPLGGGRSPRR